LESERRFRALFEASPLGILVTSQQGAIAHANAALGKMLGVTPPSLVGDSLHRFWMPGYNQVNYGSHEQAIRSEPNVTTRYQRVVRGADGNPLWTQITTGTIRDASGRAVEVIRMIEDITEQTATLESLASAERHARNNESRLRAVLDTSVEGVISMDSAGVVQSFNAAAEGLFGYAAADVIGQNVSILMPEPDKSAHDSYLANYLTTHIPKIIGIGRDVTALRKDASTFPMELTVGDSVLDGERLFTGIARDITERVEGQRARALAEHRYQDIVENAVEGIYQTTPGGGFLSANPALARVLGYDSPMDLLRAVTDIGTQIYVDADARLKFAHILETIGEVEGFEAQLYRQDGSVIWASENAHAVYEGDGVIVRFEGAVLDITTRKAMETQLVEGREKLEIANEELLTANRAKDDFLSTIFHELRTPLTSVKGFADILQAYDDIDADSRKELYRHHRERKQPVDTADQRSARHRKDRSRSHGLGRRPGERWRCH
jgi:two-component system sensor histidine kinase/response regulator